MTIIAPAERTDARASARIIARTARRCITGELDAASHRTELASLLRLLNACRSHGFEGHAYQPRQPNPAEAIILKPIIDRSIVDLSGAVSVALREGFSELDEDAAIGQASQVIMGIAKVEAVSETAREATLRFLDALNDRLGIPHPPLGYTNAAGAAYDANRAQSG